MTTDFEKFEAAVRNLATYRSGELDRAIAEALISARKVGEITPAVIENIAVDLAALGLFGDKRECKHQVNEFHRFVRFDLKCQSEKIRKRESAERREFEKLAALYAAMQERAAGVTLN